MTESLGCTVGGTLGCDICDKLNCSPWVKKPFLGHRKRLGVWITASSSAPARQQLDVTPVEPTDISFFHSSYTRSTPYTASFMVRAAEVRITLSGLSCPPPAPRDPRSKQARSYAR